MKNKTKISISLKTELVNYLNDLSLNKSKFIEKLIVEHKNKNTKNDTDK
jgi:metal-responsive CopG/Arc/MetJ family transcriptional regulator